MLSSVFPPTVGGSAVVYHNILSHDADTMIGLGPRTNYATGEPIPGIDAFDAQAPFEIHRLPATRPRLGSGARDPLYLISAKLEELYVHARLLRRCLKLIAEKKITVVCIGELIACGWLMGWLKRLTGTKQLAYVHGEDVTVRAEWSRKRRYRYLRQADHIVAVSSFTRDALVNQLGVPHEKISIIHNGVDLDFFGKAPDPAKTRALRERLGIGNRRVILTVGRLVKRKGFDHSLEALARLAHEIPDFVYLVVGNGPEREALAAQAKRLGLADRVVFVGQVDNSELRHCYDLAEFFLMPNRDMPDGDTEGFGLVFLEANAAGKPVISGRAGGVPDAVNDGENGLTVNGHDPEDIAQAVRRLLTDDALRERLAEGGLERTRNAGWAQRASEFAALCRRLTHETTPPAPHGPSERAITWPRRPVAALPRSQPPQLLVVVDTEEEFDWTKPFSRSNTSVQCIQELPPVQELFQHYGVKPVYVVDYPVVADEQAASIVRGFVQAGRAEIGAHLQPWVNPPNEEAINAFNSFTSNLSYPLQKRKLAALTDRIEETIGRRPRIYKAGRYGVGAQTPQMLAELGYRYDTSVVPYTDYSEEGGTDFRHIPHWPFRFGPDESLLEIPMTRGFTGALAALGPRLYPIIASPTGERLHIPGVFSRLGLLDRLTLTPEGMQENHLISLARHMVADGHRVFCLSFHSSTLLPGSTAYVETDKDYAVFIQRIRRFLDVFTGELGGQPTTFEALDAAFREADEPTRV